MIDIHAHPFLMPEISKNGLSALVSLMCRGKEAGVTAVVGAAVDLASGRQLSRWSAEQPSLKVALGIHPWYLDDFGPQIIASLVKECQSVNNLVAIGEIGLDKTINTPLEVQMAAFIPQLDLAAKLGLPAIIHARRCGQLIVDILQSRHEQPVVLHSFSGSIEQLGLLLKRPQVYVSFSGSVTRPGAKKLHKLAQALPLERILLETDAPSINIEGVTMGTVEPAHLPFIAAKVAELRGLSIAEVAMATTENSQKILGIKND